MDNTFLAQFYGKSQNYTDINDEFIKNILYKKILVYYITKNILYKSQIYTVYNIFIVNVYCIDTQIVIIYVIMKILFLCILKK